MTAANRLELTIERTIPAPPGEVFDAWLDPRIPGTPWNAAERFILDAKVDGLFYWTLKGTSHYGRFTALERPHCIAHTWVSPNTLGEESTVTVTFTKLGDATRMTLVHSGLPDHERARGHERGWSYFVETFREQFGDGSRRPYRWEEAHPPATE
ncbi:MAG: SRPBCC domain-containing protein [Gemmatimonadaceae bacterium]|nr:SRPBCC domain-containing protein [Gemmatimonadaceae bacterium]